MISLEQVHALEARVEKAVSLIATLREQNAELRRRVEEEHSFVDEAAVELEAAESARASAEERVAELEKRVSDAETKAAELAGRIEDYRRDQTKIEEGILHALDKLDSFEDLILGQASPEIASPAATAASRSAKPPAKPPEKTPAGIPVTETAEAAAALPGDDAAFDRTAAKVAAGATEPENRGPDTELDIF